LIATAAELVQAARAARCVADCIDTGHKDRYRYVWWVGWDAPSADRARHLCDVRESGAEPTPAKALLAAEQALARITAAIPILTREADRG